MVRGFLHQLRGDRLVFVRLASRGNRRRVVAAVLSARRLHRRRRHGSVEFVKFIVPDSGNRDGSSVDRRRLSELIVKFVFVEQFVKFVFVEQFK